MAGIRANCGIGSWIRKAYAVAVVVAVAGFLTINGCNIDTREPYRRLQQGSGIYFGYSVLLHYHTDYSWRVLVGAPLADGVNSYRTSANRAGGLFECELDGDCSKVQMDDNTATSRLDTIVDNPDDGWMGMTLARQPSRIGEVTVCGHRFRNDYAIKQAGADLKDEKIDQYVQGLCYSLRASDLTVQKRFSPCSKSDAWKDDVLVNDTLRWQGWCQFGISSTYTIEGEDDTLIVGAVGSFNWTGTTFKQKTPDLEDMVNGDLSDWNEDYSYEGFYQYNGYSTSVGHFVTNTSQEGVSGAPRAGGLVGKVYIYHLTDYTILQELKGEMMGTYFGAAVEALDINDDNFTDLIVGAPLYSTDRDEGRIYVYMNNQEGRSPLVLVQTIDATSTPGSRFGFSIKNLGDLNNDNKSDVAIGAPYEGGGVVYIYQGAENGLDNTYIQRINGTETDADVMTFGSSIEGGYGDDYDGNFYPDIVIGAYGSDSVYMFKTRPLIKVESTVIVAPDPLDPENPTCVDPSGAACLDIAVCFTYNGPNLQSLPLSIEVIFDLEIDSVKTVGGFQPRFLIRQNDTGEMSNKFENIEETVRGQESNCFNYTALLQETATDFLSAMPVEVSYIVKEYEIEPPPRGDAPYRFVQGLSPVMESYQCGPLSNSDEVTFVRECGADAICQTDIQLTADIEIDGDASTTEIVVGGSAKLYVNARVDNVGEEAHQAFLIIKHVLDMPFESLETHVLSCIDDDVGCVIEQIVVTCEPLQLPEFATVKCNLGNPMKANQAMSLRIRFDVGGLIWSSDRSIDVSLEAITSSVQENSTLPDNSKNFHYDIIVEADTGIFSSVKPESVYYSSNSSRYADAAAQDKALSEAVNMALSDTTADMFNDSYIGQAFNLSYQVTNEGPGMLPFGSELLIHIPWRMENGDWLVYLKNIIISQSSSAKADCDAAEILDVQHNHLREIYVTNTGSLKAAPQEKVVPMNREAAGATEQMGCNRAKCVALTCHIEPMQARQFLAIQIEAILWEHSFITREDLGYVEILTEANITVASNGDHGQGADEIPDKIQLEVTVFTDMVPAEKVPIWVYIVAIIGGVILLVLIVVIMYMCGFFKRKTLDERIAEHEDDESKAGPKPIKPPMDSGDLDGSNMPMMDGPAMQKE